MPDWISSLTVAQLAALLAGLAAVGGLTWAAGRWLRRAGHLIDDLLGEPARPGVDARPGLMERVQRIEHEVTYNSGGSLKDKVRALDGKLGDLSTALQAHTADHQTAPTIRQDITVQPPGGPV
ncbi:hypothetical protein [Allonocardiopsis opalescens]|uniref:Uncharacterized protein n=1 Tax=Allonocardiopsis opalescens TaxID=1144618 RepID=A0A2T0PPI2_9ACTN|nr:hypothetical protein [Allonocardiopsis opalescens]PRX90815.1 hypothetical protein CLV72_11611 [Allonocardiopsis opalescens]